MDVSGHLLLGAMWILWCTLHSAFISQTFTRWQERTFPRFSRFSRIAYNLFSLITFGVVYWYYRTLPSPTLWAWPEAWVYLQYLLLAAGGIIILLGAREYNQRYFLGIEQLEGTSTASGKGLKASGILRHLRHPYYTGGIIILAAWGDFTWASIISKAVLIGYLIIGTFIEERKLLDEFGDEYREYMRRTPRFFFRLTKTPAG
ncbi:MAG: hypothetical protein CL946_10260 [Ectothiorhodospiraceae bacterium]|nr:hypothetical protein [Ectothiorhodospiraceae bacterium]